MTADSRHKPEQRTKPVGQVPGSGVTTEPSAAPGIPPLLPPGPPPVAVPVLAPPEPMGVSPGPAIPGREGSLLQADIARRAAERYTIPVTFGRLRIIAL